MTIKIRSFGGPVIWFLRKYCSSFTSKIAFSIIGKVRAKKIDGFIKSFMEASEVPVFRFLMLETVNRCNGTCSFCPANIKAEAREFKKMSQELFDKIISDLVEADWVGTFFLQVNNEPFIDVRILEFAAQIREKLPECEICLISNGTLLNVDKIKEMRLLVDELIINDYSRDYRLNKNLREIYRHVRKHKEMFSGMKICINRRYSEEILATRAGNAPNKPVKNNRIKASCIYPFTDMIIFPDGKVGMCCNDCKEITNFGNVEKENLFAIWKNEKFTKLRCAMMNGRENYPFCRECDVIDAGSREKIIES